jgi:hypothetical protein
MVREESPHIVGDQFNIAKNPAEQAGRLEQKATNAAENSSNCHLLEGAGTAATVLGFVAAAEYIRRRRAGKAVKKG